MLQQNEQMHPILFTLSKDYNSVSDAKKIKLIDHGTSTFDSGRSN